MTANAIAASVAAEDHPFTVDIRDGASDTTTLTISTPSGLMFTAECDDRAQAQAFADFAIAQAPLLLPSMANSVPSGGTGNSPGDRPEVFAALVIGMLAFRAAIAAEAARVAQ